VHIRSCNNLGSLALVRSNTDHAKGNAGNGGDGQFSPVSIRSTTICRETPRSSAAPSRALRDAFSE